MERDDTTAAPTAALGELAHVLHHLIECIKERGDVMKPLAFAALAAMALGLSCACDRRPETPVQPSLQTTFDQADKNRDGAIERSEATHIANREFAEVDTDDDQYVSFDEFRVAQGNPAPPPG